ncbi:MAG TPA: transcription termination/antitermination NusG family protein [Bryobacteraceae bacterium]|nr:transcription termination/antitermination NusG family protein [Bryobacteraceae bacterium]
MPVTQNADQWFALRIAPRHEKTVSGVLCNKGYETLLPLCAHSHRYGRRSRSFDLPLFPGYLFCRFAWQSRLPILTTPGVLRLVGAGKLPVPVADQEIWSLRRAMQEQVSMHPHPYWVRGQRARITDGALAGIEGIVTSAKPPFRLVLSVELLQRSVLLEIDQECISLI